MFKNSSKISSVIGSVIKFTSEVKYEPVGVAESSQRTNGAISVHPGPAALLCQTPVSISFGREGGLDPMGWLFNSQTNTCTSNWAIK